jgi:hypothetical protein
MNAMSPFFRYEVRTRCGIPEFHLCGTEEDWIRVRANFVHLVGLFGAHKHMLAWKKHMLPVLDAIIETAAGRGNLSFWRDMYHESSISGGLQVTGWLRILFPYEDIHGKILPNLFDYHGTNIANFPSGMARVPFNWKIAGVDKAMFFLAGHIGVVQDTVGVIHPVIGWAVQEG